MVCLLYLADLDKLRSEYKMMIQEKAKARIYDFVLIEIMTTKDPFQRKSHFLSSLKQTFCATVLIQYR